MAPAAVAAAVAQMAVPVPRPTTRPVRHSRGRRLSRAQSPPRSNRRPSFKFSSVLVDTHAAEKSPDWLDSRLDGDGDGDDEVAEGVGEPVHHVARSTPVSEQRVTAPSAPQ